MCHELLKRASPFVCLVATELLMEIPRDLDGKRILPIAKALDKTSRFIYSTAGYTVVIGNVAIPVEHHQIGT